MLSFESDQRDGAHGAAFVDDHLDGRPLRLDDDGGHHRGRRDEVLGVALVVAVGAAAVVAALVLVAPGLLGGVVAGALVDDAARSDHVALFDRLASVEVVLTADQVELGLVVTAAVARLEAVGVAADTVARALDAAVVQLDDFLRHVCILRKNCLKDVRWFEQKLGTAVWLSASDRCPVLQLLAVTSSSCSGPRARGRWRRAPW